MEFDYFGISQRARKKYAQLLEPVCQKWDLTKNELDVLLFLANNPEYDRAADIVAHRGLAKSHVSLSVTNLECRRLLERHFSPTDRRVAHLILTEQGNQIAGEAREAQKHFFAALYQGISAEEFQIWRSITQKVCDNIENLDKTLINLG